MNQFPVWQLLFNDKRPVQPMFRVTNTGRMAHMCRMALFVFPFFSKKKLYFCRFPLRATKTDLWNLNEPLQATSVSTDRMYNYKFYSGLGWTREHALLYCLIIRKIFTFLWVTTKRKIRP